MSTVLVTDCWTNKALSVVRSLGLAGLEVHVAGHKHIASAMYSRLVKKRVFVSGESELRAFIRDSHYDCVIPLEENTIRMLQVAEEIPRSLVALPPTESLAVASDKLATW